MKPGTITLLVVLAVVVMAAIAEYTVGGGWHQLANTVGKARTKAPKPVVQPFLKLPSPMGRKDAPARFEFLVAPCPRLTSEIAQIVDAFWPLQDKAYVVFQAVASEPEPTPVSGEKPVLCHLHLRINGAETLKVPWRGKPILDGGLGAPYITDKEYKRLVEWLGTPEGQASVKRQLEAETKAETKDTK